MTTILITGASSGIGHSLVERALRRGERVFGAARMMSDLSDFADHPNFTGIEMDVGSGASVEAAFAAVDKQLGDAPLQAVINCAGVAPFGAVELLDFATYELVNNTNFLGSVRVARAAVPRLRGHGGRLVFVTSLWGIVSGPMLSAYTSSKFAVEALADSLRRETQGMKLHVIVAQPGVVHTRMLSDQVAATRAEAQALDGEAAVLYGEAYRGYAEIVARGARMGISAEKAAEGIEAALRARRPRSRYRIGSDAKAVWLLSRILTSGSWDAIFRKMLRTPGQSANRLAADAGKQQA